MTLLRKNKLGFGLIEILVTLAVISVGVTGVFTLQANIAKQILNNKINTEALAIARFRIEELRGKSKEAHTIQEFHALFAESDQYVNPTSVTGKNTVYVRSEKISSFNQSKTLIVKVVWVNSDGTNKNIELHSALSHLPLRSSGDSIRKPRQVQLASPIERVVLTETTFRPDGAMRDNEDGTALYQDNDNNLMLAVNNMVVLTLKGACSSLSEECKLFARIRGRVYIDTITQGFLTPGEVQIVASGATYCARYFTVENHTYPVTANSREAATTQNRQYEYFDYTCYARGGWYGNIGIILPENTDQRNMVCLGDPTTAERMTRAKLSTRRVYRGVIYELSTLGPIGEEFPSGHESNISYFTHGIANDTTLPTPNSDDATHDFVVGSTSELPRNGDDCIQSGVMTRSDATVNGVSGGLFKGNSADFVCLNDGLLSDYDTLVYGHDLACPH